MHNLAYHYINTGRKTLTLLTIIYPTQHRCILVNILHSLFDRLQQKPWHTNRATVVTMKQRVRKRQEISTELHPIWFRRCRRRWLPKREQQVNAPECSAPCRPLQLQSRRWRSAGARMRSGNTLAQVAMAAAGDLGVLGAHGGVRRTQREQSSRRRLENRMVLPLIGGSVTTARVDPAHRHRREAARGGRRAGTNLDAVLLSAVPSPARWRRAARRGSVEEGVRRVSHDRTEGFRRRRQPPDRRDAEEWQYGMASPWKGRRRAMGGARDVIGDSFLENALLYSEDRCLRILRLGCCMFWRGPTLSPPLSIP
jgi:hypothetical protein